MTNKKQTEILKELLKKHESLYFYETHHIRLFIDAILKFLIEKENQKIKEMEDET